MSAHQFLGASVYGFFTTSTAHMAANSWTVSMKYFFWIKRAASDRKMISAFFCQHDSVAEPFASEQIEKLKQSLDKQETVLRTKEDNKSVPAWLLGRYWHLIPVHLCLLPWHHQNHGNDLSVHEIHDWSLLLDRDTLMALALCRDLLYVWGSHGMSGSWSCEVSD